MPLIRKIAVLVTLLALAWTPTGAMAFVFGPPAVGPGPMSVTMGCSTGATMIGLSNTVGTKTFNLTDVTIANANESTHEVSIFDNDFGGVSYAVPAGSTVTQKFETPIRFISSVNSPYLQCDSSTSSVQVSIQGTVQ